MNDLYAPLERELMGTVRYVDDIGIVYINWENDLSLGAVLEDKIELI